MISIINVIVKIILLSRVKKQYESKKVDKTSIRRYKRKYIFINNFK